MFRHRLSEKARTFTYQIESEKKTSLRQLITVSDFNDVKTGTPGVWVDNKSVLSQQGHCWIYDGTCRDGNYRQCANYAIQSSL